VLEDRNRLLKIHTELLSAMLIRNQLLITISKWWFLLITRSLHLEKSSKTLWRAILKISLKT